MKIWIDAYKYYLHHLNAEMSPQTPACTALLRFLALTIFNKTANQSRCIFVSINADAAGPECTDIFV